MVTLSDLRITKGIHKTNAMRCRATERLHLERNEREIYVFVARVAVNAVVDVELEFETVLSQTENVHYT